MLSHQIYTSKYSKIPITNIFAGNPERSIQNIFVHPSEGTQKITYETPSVVAATGMAQFPTSPQNKVKHEIDTVAQPEKTQPIPIFQYTTKLSTQLFDPTIINTPPSEFMNQLKSRLDGYYSASP